MPEDKAAMAPLPMTGDRAAALRLLIRWLQHEGEIDSHRPSLEQIADLCGVGRDGLNRFLRRQLKRDEDLNRAADYAAHLSGVLHSQPDIPAPVGDLLEAVYGIALPGNSVIDMPDVAAHRSLSQAEEGASPLDPLLGLHFLVRIANEAVPDPASDPADPRTMPGWSLGLLNLPPPQVQTGRHHPLFKLSQTGRNLHDLDVEGVVLAKSDRIVLEGVSTGLRRRWVASLPVSTDGVAVYRAPGRFRPLRGVMLGLSTSRAAFAGPFLLYPVPETVLPPGAKAPDRERFGEIHDAARRVLGVFDLEETLQRMAQCGVQADENDLVAMRRLASQSLLFSTA